MHEVKTPEDERLLSLLHERYFEPYPAIEMADLQGALPDDERGVFMIGMYAGLAWFDPTVVAHEMAHLVEADEDRLGEPSWGMIMPRELYIPGMRDMGYEDFETPKHVLRECRVWAFQKSLQDALGFPEQTVEEITSAWEFLPSLHVVPEPWETRHAWVCEQVKEAMRWATFDEFEQRWADRMPKLAEIMARRQAEFTPETPVVAW